MFWTAGEIRSRDRLVGEVVSENGDHTHVVMLDSNDVYGRGFGEYA
jgi:hypothetical protein